eukprot:scaffold6361_cov132-Isochrysis_galbana.AAC.14
MTASSSRESASNATRAVEVSAAGAPSGVGSKPTPARRSRGARLRLAAAGSCTRRRTRAAVLSKDDRSQDRVAAGVSAARISSTSSRRRAGVASAPCAIASSPQSHSVRASPPSWPPTNRRGLALRASCHRQPAATATGGKPWSASMAAPPVRRLARRSSNERRRTSQLFHSRQSPVSSTSPSSRTSTATSRACSPMVAGCSPARSGPCASLPRFSLQGIGAALKKKRNARPTHKAVLYTDTFSSRTNHQPTIPTSTMRYTQSHASDWHRLTDLKEGAQRPAAPPDRAVRVSPQGAIIQKKNL